MVTLARDRIVERTQWSLCLKNALAKRCVPIFPNKHRGPDRDDRSHLASLHTGHLIKCRKVSPHRQCASRPWSARLTEPETALQKEEGPPGLGSPSSTCSTIYLSVDTLPSRAGADRLIDEPHCRWLYGNAALSGSASRALASSAIIPAFPVFHSAHHWYWTQYVASESEARTVATVVTRRLTSTCSAMPPPPCARRPGGPGRVASTAKCDRPHAEPGRGNATRSESRARR
jgi:hypothetical protein